MMVLKISLDTKIVKLLNHYVLNKILNILKTTKKHVIFTWWWWCNFEIQQTSVEFDSQPVYNEKCIKTRVKPFEDKVITKFIDNEIPKENAIIYVLLHFVLILYIRKRKLSSSKSWALYIQTKEKERHWFIWWWIRRFK